MKCIECGSKVEAKETGAGKEIYVCPEGHRVERMIDHSGVKTIIEDSEVLHESVGAIIKTKGQILFLKRRKYPYKYSIPAGHMEDGEEPVGALVREVREETAIELSESDPELIFEGDVDDKCRRGADIHRWHLFLVQLDEKPEVKSNEEADHLKWIGNPFAFDITQVNKLLFNRVTAKIGIKLQSDA